MLAVAGLVAASVSISQAQPYYVSGAALTPAWAPGTPANQMTGGPTVYSLTTATVANTYNEFKITGATWSDPNWPSSSNAKISGDANGTNTFYFYPGTITDGWNPTQNRVGYADPGNMPWEIAGDFTSPNWGSDSTAQLVSAGNGLYTNTYVIATAGTHNFKFRTTGTWGDAQVGTDFGDNPGNGIIITTTVNQPILFQLDLPNGRWQAGGPPAFCNVSFSVDMSVVATTDPGFAPTSVTVNGDAIGWGGTTCTNNPTAANTNVYSSPFFNIAVGTSVNYQFRYLSSGNTVYDALGGVSGVNRSVVVPNLTSTNIPAVYFNDALPTDLLNVDTLVTFSVSMTNAVGVTNAAESVPHVFDPANDYVFINGDFVGWLAWNPITLYGAGLQCANNPVGSEVYTYSVTFPKGHSRSLTYKYAINGVDDEAGYAQNHFRYIRSTNGVYNLPLDTFGTLYNEPKFGNLAIGRPSGGSFPITWLGYPNVNLQSRTNLTSGTWQDVPQTTGASSTNWPTGNGSRFFRLIQP